MAEWTFLTNYAHVLLCVARNADFRLRDIAACVGITERATHRIVSDLVEAGYLTRHRSGRRNYYEVHPGLPMRHPLECDHEIGEIIGVLLRDKPTTPEQVAAENVAPAREQASPNRAAAPERAPEQVADEREQPAPERAA